MCLQRKTTHTHFVDPVVVRLERDRSYWLAPGEATTPNIGDAVVYNHNDPWLDRRDALISDGLMVVPLPFLAGSVIANNERPTVSDMIETLVAPGAIGRYAVNVNGSLGRIVEVGTSYYRGYTEKGEKWSGGIGSAILLTFVEFSW